MRPITLHIPELSAEEIARYSRHLLMPEVTIDGQRRLKAARVLCIGAGGLGSPAALYLAAAGVGTIGSDRHRWCRSLESAAADSCTARKISAGRKLESARDRLREVNPTREMSAARRPFHAARTRWRLSRDYDVVVDGSDNFPTRYLSNDVCVWAGKPNVYGSIFRFDGQTTVFAPHLGGPCYRCLFPEPPPPGAVPNCAEAGVLGVLPGIIGTLQATRGDQADSRHRRSAGRSAAAFRRVENEISRIQPATRSGLSGLRREPDDHGADRLRAVLRRRDGANENAEH